MKTLKELGISPTPWMSNCTIYPQCTLRVCGIEDAECKTITKKLLQDDISEKELIEAGHNADLIAAAPDLYEVVRALVDDFAKAGEMDICTLVGKAEAALKKAGGAE